MPKPNDTVNTDSINTAIVLGDTPVDWARPVMMSPSPG